MKKSMKKCVAVMVMCLLMLLSSGCYVSDRVQKEIMDFVQSPSANEEASAEPTRDDEESPVADMDEQETDAEFIESLHQINLGIDPESGTFDLGISLDGLRVFPAYTEEHNPSSLPMVAVYYSVFNFSGQSVNPLSELEEHIVFYFNGEQLGSTQSMSVANFESGADEMLVNDTSGMYATLFMMPYFPEEKLAQKTLQVGFIADDGTVVKALEYSIADLLDDYVF